MKEILAVGFFPNHRHILDCLSEIADTFMVEPDDPDIVTRIGGIDKVQRLDINFEQYHTCLIYSDSLSEGQDYLLRECLKHSVQVIGNQHGCRKTVYDIAESVPNKYSRFWFCYGQYMLDLYERTTGKNANQAGWYPIGSIKHDNMFRNHRWDKHKTNSKVLLLHEPDADNFLAPGSLTRSEMTAMAIEELEKNNIKYDFKLHPSFKSFRNKDGEKLWSPPASTNLVDIGLLDMLDYECLIGSWSTCLLDAAAMAMPVLNLDFPAKKTSHITEWTPGKIGLFELYKPEDIVKALGKKSLNDFDQKKLEYVLGPLGYVLENMQNFINKSLK